ncbi:hypothetical protein ACF1GT_02450 [Streptomyces sp. NPDC014636]|uniref:hypothetical protein n=1 Tax=Streptomyces sp. NPDC014636 TaxID=3364876 RepID=UPI0037034B54
MIGSWVGCDGSVGRSRRAALLVGLVLVLAAHLTGAVHACPFAGADPSAVVAWDVPHAADRADGTRPAAPPPGPRHVADGADGTRPTAPPPGPRHAADGHVGHTADRPRAALDGTGLGSEVPQPVLPAVSRGRSAHPGWCGRPGVPRPCGNGSSPALVRVLRQ